jgi:hypothetical protein
MRSRNLQTLHALERQRLLEGGNVIRISVAVISHGRDPMIGADPGGAAPGLGTAAMVGLMRVGSARRMTTGTASECAVARQSDARRGDQIRDRRLGRARRWSARFLLNGKQREPALGLHQK